MRALLWPAVAGLLAMMFAGPVAAEWYETRITATPDPSTRPDVTFDAEDGLHILWEEAGEIRHLEHSDSGWGEVEVVGTGSGFDRFTCLV